MKLIEILKDTNYKLTQFSEEHIADFEKNIIVKEIKGKSTPYVACAIRNKEIKLTPEEVVRQLYLKFLMQDLNYPKDRIVLEYEVTFGREKKRADIVILDKDTSTTAYIIVEVKKPKLKDGKDQLRSYCNATGAPIGVWTNGDSISYYHRKDPNYFEDISHIPSAYQKLSDILNERYTIDDLIKKDKLVNERKSLKDLILEMEDEVLANAGVDVFEELFKLIFTKLFDEMQSGRNKSRFLEFRNSGDTETELKNKIQKLFDQAKSKWEGVFSDDSKIQLTPSHLSVCVSSLQDVKLFNSNLDVVDEAFEYLINKSSKGEKGQYFTPRYVIDMCVKMLNPQRHETIIDTASGSCGFPVHSIFYVWEQILKEKGLSKSHLFTLEDKPQECTDYVVDKVFAIDFDERAVRVARTLNLIAGDGQTNVLHINTLDWERWDEKTSDEDWIDTYNEGWKKLKKLREDKNSNRDFQFDILMANPPFAGDIKESRILAKYDLGKKSDGKSQNKVGRDILFIERNLDFLKDGGRMAIVLPQGRFNNSSDKAIREFIAERCRILAVVGLHGNVFKPHTGTKTSVLFVQKWDDELCPKVEDYPIFFATMQEPSKDSSGEKIYVTQRFIRYFENGEIAELLEEDYIRKYGSIEENTLWLSKKIYAQNIGKIPNKSNALALGAINNIEYKLLDEEEQKNYVNLFTPILETRYKLDSHGHLIVKHDLFNHDGLTHDGIAEAFIEFAKKEKFSFVGKN
ncbi:N-6 DNA methylase [Capnocytophaga cynodegmi]|uniref:N-6 DNA methylase n=1 Tax=Capnocytophaga cynodegmi TaxID=28189 RepID=UPI00385A97E7